MFDGVLGSILIQRAQRPRPAELETSQIECLVQICAELCVEHLIANDVSDT